MRNALCACRYAQPWAAALAPVTGKPLQEVAIQGSVSLALHLGQAVQEAQTQKADPVAAAALAGQGKLMSVGERWSCSIMQYLWL
jgi:DUF917 family protein